MISFYNLLNEQETHYLDSLIGNTNLWEYRTYHKDKQQFYDSLKVDVEKLKNYYDTITENGKYEIKETGLNVIKAETQVKNKHVDDSDLSYVTYLNEDFEGGEFFYYLDKKKFEIKPKIGLTIKIDSGVMHEVNHLNEGIRYSLYTFLIKKQKKINTLL